MADFDESNHNDFPHKMCLIFCVAYCMYSKGLNFKPGNPGITRSLRGSSRIQSHNSAEVILLILSSPISYFLSKDAVVASREAAGESRKRQDFGDLLTC